MRTRSGWGNKEIPAKANAPALWPERLKTIEAAELAGGEHRADSIKDGADLDAEGAQGNHGHDGDENDDQRVLDQTLALFLGLEQILNPGDSVRKHCSFLPA